MRDTTERPEAFSAGTVVLVGTIKYLIVSESNELLINTVKNEKNSKAHNPYGDGKASMRLLNTLI